MDDTPAILAAEFRVGTIGFTYPDWQPAFYPANLNKADRLTAYARAFDTLELDTTFYGTPPVERVAVWAQAVPEGFLFCPKAPRAITHETAPPAAALPMRGFLESLTPMHDAGKLGPILLQYPPSFARYRAADLAAFLSRLPATHRFAIELRHASWLHPSTVDLLAEHQCAWVAADYSTNPWPPHRTTDFLYLRFVGQHHCYTSYEKERFDPTPQLEQWLTRVRPLLDATAPPGSAPAARAVQPRVFALFADDFAGHAPATANRFRRMVGLPTSTPTAAPPANQPSLFE